MFWYHDGELILNDARHIFETMDGESILKIPDAKRVDRGEYTVKATNKLGEDTSSFLVTVTGRYVAVKVRRSVDLGIYRQTPTLMLRSGKGPKFPTKPFKHGASTDRCW